MLEELLGTILPGSNGTEMNIMKPQRNLVTFTLMVGILAWGSFFLSDPSWAKTYQCKDSTGKKVLTDSPAQLKGCELLSNENSPAQRPVFSRPSIPNQPVAPPTNQGYEDEIFEEDTNLKEDSPNHRDNEPKDTKTVTVPVRRSGGSLIVPVQLNNEKSVQLILDTGATMTVLSTDVAIELGLTSDSQSQVATVNTAGGPVQVNITRVQSMGVNSAKANNVVVAIHDLPNVQPGIDGLLGMSFLNNFLVTLDSDQGQLKLQKR